MLSLSSTYYKIIQSDYKVKVQIEIDGHTYDEEQILTLKTAKGLFESDTPSVGNVISGEIQIEMLKPSETFSRMAKIVVRTAVTNGTLTSEWIQNGIYYIDTRKTLHNYVGEDILTLTGYDATMKLEQYYEISGVSYPVNDRTIFQTICSKVGLEIESQSLEAITGKYSVRDPDGYTYRDILKFIAAGYSGNFTITNDEKLRFVPYNIIAKTDSRFGSYTIGSEAGTISGSNSFKEYSGVYIEDGYDDDGNPKRFSKYDTSKYSSFDDAKQNGLVLKIENDLITDKDSDEDYTVNPQVIAENVYNDIHGWVYQPYEFEESILPPHVELGDTIVLNIKPNKTLTSGAYYISSEFGTFTVSELKAPFDEEMDHEFSYDDRSKRKKVSSTNSTNSAGVSSLNSFTGISEAQADAAANPDDSDAGDRISLYARKAKNSSQVGVWIESTSEGIEVTVQKTGIRSILNSGETLLSKLIVNYNNITAKCSRSGGTDSFSWKLTEDQFTCSKGYNDVLTCNASGLILRNCSLLSGYGNSITCSNYVNDTNSGSIVSIPTSKFYVNGKTVSWKSGSKSISFGGEVELWRDSMMSILYRYGTYMGWANDTYASGGYFSVTAANVDMGYFFGK